MENNNHKKRKVMLIAAFAVAVIALAGVGYAASLGYKATTVNDTNTATAVYVKVTQTNYNGQFGGDIEFNTYTDDAIADGIYSLVDNDTIGNGSTGQAVGAGTTLIFANSGDTAPLSYDIEMSTTVALPTGWTYVFKFVGAQTDYITYNGSWSGSINIAPDASNHIAVTMYITSEDKFEELAEDGNAKVSQTYIETYMTDYFGHAASTTAPTNDPTTSFYTVDVIFTITANDEAVTP